MILAKLGLREGYMREGRSGTRRTHVRDVRLRVRHAACLYFVFPVRVALGYVVPVPLVRTMHVPVNPVPPPCLVELLLVVHVEHPLQEAAADPPEIGEFLKISQFEPLRPVPKRERRAIGSALRLGVRQTLVEQDQRYGIVARHRAHVVLY